MKSVKKSLMALCLLLVLAVCVVVGGVAIISIRSTTELAMTNYETAMNEGYNEEIKSQVQSVITVLQTAYDKYNAGILTEAEAKAEACEIVRNMRYGDDASGYFWIDDTAYTLIMHPILSEQAGDAGRGFAVVAEEIGHLATQSAETATGINVLIKELTENSQKSVELMNEMNVASQIQVETLQNTQEMFFALKNALSSCVSSIHLITDKIENMNIQRECMTDNIEVLNHLSTDNAASTEETSAMAMELDGAVKTSAMIVQKVMSHTNTLVTNADRFKL